MRKTKNSWTNPVRLATYLPGSRAMRFYYHHPKIGPEFIRRLYTEMDVTLFRNPRQGPAFFWTKHPIPMRPRFSSIGFFLEKGRLHSKMPMVGPAMMSQIP